MPDKVINKVSKLQALLDKANKKPSPVKSADKHPTSKSKSSGRPTAAPLVNHGKVVNYYVEYEDGVAALAQGKHADLIYRFTREAQQLATMHAFAYYEGPPLTEMTKEEALKQIQETQLTKSEAEAK